jgi:hypothetical protein
MAIGIGATGELGLAIESSRGTYVVATKWVPIRSESITVSQEMNYRRNIRGIADALAPQAGNLTYEGDIEFEASPDVLPYFFKAMRTSETKTGSGDPYTYVYVPTHGALSTDSLSLYVERNGIRFGYSGVSVTGMAFTITDGLLICTATVSALAEATQSDESSSFSNETPFYTGTFSVEIPDSSAVTDMDNISWAVTEGGSVNHRLNGSTNPASITMGERSVTCSMDRDFDSRADLDLFELATATSLKIVGSYTTPGGYARYLSLEMPVATMETYDVNLGGQGDIVRASISYTGSYNAGTTGAYRATVKTEENIS